MRCTSRIYMKFNDKAKWEQFLKDFKFNDGAGNTHTLHEFLDDPFACYQYFANGVNLSEKKLDCEIGEYYDSDNLDRLTRMIYNKVKDDAVILAESYCYSNYPETCYELYSAGGTLHTYDRLKSAEKHFKLPVSDIKAWLGATRVKELSAEEKAFLKQFI